MKKYRYLIVTGVLLAALAPSQTNAAPNTWNNAQGNYVWDTTTANWTSPTTWLSGDDAIFDATANDPLANGPTVTLGSYITAHSLTFNAKHYTISGFFNNLTLTGSIPTITANADCTNGAAIYGTDGLTVQGTAVLTIQGDPQFDGNHYTGGTYIKSGTVVLQAPLAGTSGSSGYAVDSIQALDTNATLVIPGVWGVTNYGADRDQMAVNGQLAPAFCQLNMTGGTLDFQNDPKNQRVPIPSGYGVILNSGASVQAQNTEAAANNLIPLGIGG